MGQLRIITLVCLIVFGKIITANEISRKEVSGLLNAMLKDYDKRLRPKFNGVPAQIGIHIRILSISTISELDMEFTVDMFFRQHWEDERLVFNLTSGIKYISIGQEILEQIWVPDTYFVNERKGSFHETTKRNTFVRMRDIGEVYLR